MELASLLLTSLRRRLRSRGTLVSRFRRLFLAVLATTVPASLLPASLRAQSLEGCTEKVSAQIRVDAGHPWRPPFGVARVGAPPVAHVELISEPTAYREYYVVAFLSVDVGRSGLSLSLFGTNLTDTSYFTAGFASNPLNDCVSMAPPREWGLSAQ